MTRTVHPCWPPTIPSMAQNRAIDYSSNPSNWKTQLLVNASQLPPHPFWSLHSSCWHTSSRFCCILVIRSIRLNNTVRGLPLLSGIKYQYNVRIRIRLPFCRFSTHKTWTALVVKLILIEASLWFGFIAFGFAAKNSSLTWPSSNSS